MANAHDQQQPGRFDQQGQHVSGDQINVGRDFILNEADTSYDVHGLTTPYPGLRAFTAAERDIFAGRERIVTTLVERLSRDDGDRLLFIDRQCPPQYSWMRASDDKEAR